MHAGGYTPFGIEGWRVVFLTVGVVSFALGILNYFFAHDPRYAQDNKSVLKEHQHSMSFWGAIAEMKRIVVIPSFAIIILQVSNYNYYYYYYCYHYYHYHPAGELCQTH